MIETYDLSDSSSGLGIGGRRKPTARERHGGVKKSVVRRGDARASHAASDLLSPADPPRPVQYPDQRPVAIGTPGVVRELAYGEVRLLLAGARPAEGNAPDLHHRRPLAGEVRSAPHLTSFGFRRRLVQETLLSSPDLVRPLIRQSSRILIRASRPEVARWTIPPWERSPFLPSFPSTDRTFSRQGRIRILRKYGPARPKV